VDDGDANWTDDTELPGDLELAIDGQLAREAKAGDKACLGALLTRRGAG
jgi:hypothetical protein